MPPTARLHTRLPMAKGLQKAVRIQVPSIRRRAPEVDRVRTGC